MSWKIALWNIALALIGLYLFDVLWARSWETVAKVTLIVAGALQADPWTKPATRRPRLFPAPRPTRES